MLTDEQLTKKWLISSLRANGWTYAKIAKRLSISATVARLHSKTLNGRHMAALNAEPKLDELTARRLLNIDLSRIAEHPDWEGALMSRFSKVD